MISKLNSRLETFAFSFAGPKSTNIISATIILAFLSFGSTINEPSNNRAELLAWTGIAYQSLALSVLYFVVVSFFINRIFRDPTIAKIFALLFLFASTEILRTIFVGISGKNLGLLENLSSGFRIIAGGTTGIVIFGLVAVAFNNNFRYRTNLQELAKVANKLSAAAQVSEDDIKEIRLQILGTIRGAVNESLNLVTKQPKIDKVNSKLVVDELVRVSEQVVRPLSHKLFSNALEIPNDKNVGKTPKISSRRIIELATSYKPFQPIPIIAMGGFMVAALAFFGGRSLINGTKTLIFMLAGFYLILEFAKRIIQPTLVLFPIWLRVIIISLVTAAMTLIIFSTGFVGSIFSVVDGFSSHFYFFVLASFVVWTFAFYEGLKVARAETLENLSETNEKLNWINARLGAQLSAERQHLASVVHRDVQGKLIASALKFQQDISLGKDQETAFKELNGLLNSITNNVIEPTKAATPMEVVEALNDIWDGIFKIDLEMDQNTKARVINDLVCRQSISDIINEFATNAVKHGKATRGQIQIHLVNDQIVALDMTNNGRPILESSESSTPGLGTKLAAAQCLSVFRRNLPNVGVHFMATMPIK